MDNGNRVLTLKGEGIITYVKTSIMNLSSVTGIVDTKSKKRRKLKRTKTNDSGINSDIEPIEMVETKEVTQNKPICGYVRDKLQVFITDRIEYENGLIKCCIPRTIEKFRPQRQLKVVEFLRIAIDIDSKTFKNIARVVEEILLNKDINNVDKVTTDFASVAEHILCMYERDSFKSSTSNDDGVNALQQYFE